MISHRLSFAVALMIAAPALAQDDAPWRDAERAVLTNHVQLTTGEQFVKAGESYFSPDGSMIIFQAVEVPEGDEAASPFYGMYVADLVRTDGRITGIDDVRRVSPLGSSNTCGWFHPTKPNTVIFGTTFAEPAEPDIAGYQRGTGRYKWQFPREMTVVECDLTKADGTAATLTPIRSDPKAYLAECSFTTDGRHLIFCKYVEQEAPAGGDLLCWDSETDTEVVLVGDEGYDGGPFFSPDEKMICYRSDRVGNNLLQVYVATLVRNEAGTITGIGREFALTANEHVNWAPFWHPSSKHLVYTTSEQGHRNYEVYWIDVTAYDPEKSKRRITSAAGFDGLPVFNADATVMMWTSQRGATKTSQLWLADFTPPSDVASP